MTPLLTGKQHGWAAQLGWVGKDFAEFYALMKLMSPRYWPRLAAFAWVKALAKLHVNAKPVVLPLRCVSAWVNPSTASGIRMLIENADGQIYSAFKTTAGTAVLFDVGANAGFVSLMRCRENPNLRAVCFEPHPDTFRVLQKNIAVNCLEGRVLARNVGVGATSGILRFFQAEGDSMAAVTTDCLMKGVPLREFSVEVVSLDDYCEQHGIWPDALKIDVEGHEEQVLLGARKVLGRTQRLVLEWHSQALRNSCESILKSHGFAVQEQGGLFFASKSDSSYDIQ